MSVQILTGDNRQVLKTLEPGSVHCCVTSPPYFGLRDYGVDGQIGLEPTPDAFVAEMVSVFREVRRVLRDDGTLWLNLGDSYASGEIGRHDANDAASGNSVINYKSLGEAQGSRRQQARLSTGLPLKNLLGIPWRVAFALQADGWYLRQDIIWHKPNPMPESVRDRCTKAHEYVFLMAKSERYFYDADAIAEPAIHAGRVIDYSGDQKANTADEDKQRTLPRGRTIEVGTTRNRRSVWSVTSEPFSGAHFATFPPSLIEPMILAGCPKGGTVLDPFGGAGTTGMVADRLGRNAVLIELNPAYVSIAQDRLRGDAGMFAAVTA